ncbi:hypothetical protein B0H14DRAFT_3585243 [Mycena olivaceomarginata]|nr:hypothetical protein B0H14DRAFT_3585243 [Mycena olivaceomarginata]
MCALNTPAVSDHCGDRRRELSNKLILADVTTGADGNNHLMTSAPADKQEKHSGKVTLSSPIFTAADYAPSISTSTQLHLPLGFPAVPSPPASDDDVPDLSSSTSSTSSASAPALTIVYEYPADDSEPPSDLSGPALVEYYQALSRKMKAQRDEAHAQREGADAHAVLAGHHIQSLQQKLNVKGKQRAGNSRTLSTTARMLTSAEGRALAEEKRLAQLEKQSKDGENRTQRLLDGAEVIRRRGELKIKLSHGLHVNALILITCLFEFGPEWRNQPDILNKKQARNDGVDCDVKPRENGVRIATIQNVN